MSTQSPAELHEELVTFGAERYRETFIELFAAECAGGRVPGTTEMSDEELHAFFRDMPVEYFQQLAVQNPARALRVLNDFARLEEQSGDAI